MNKNSKNNINTIDFEDNIFLQEDKLNKEYKNLDQNNKNEININQKINNNLQELIKNLQIDDEEINFLFTKLDKNLKHPFLNLLNLYNIEHLESLDYEKILNPEISGNLSIFLNDIQNTTYKRIIENFDLYYDKYNLKERLKTNSKLIMLKIILESLNLKPEEFIHKIKTYEENENKEFSTIAIIKNLTKQKIRSLKTYKEKLSLELENLKKQN